MASCALTQDYNFGCAVGAGGLKECYFIELENISALVESSGTITTITKAAGKIFRKYQLVLETANSDETITANRQNGTVLAAQKLTIVLNKQQVAVRNEIMLLAKNNLVAIIKDNNTTYRLLGRENGLRLTNGVASTGTALADRNGYSLDLTGSEAELAPFVDPSIIASLQT
jgi:hypothetical protein